MENCEAINEHNPSESDGLFVRNPYNRYVFLLHINQLHKFLSISLFLSQSIQHRVVRIVWSVSIYYSVKYRLFLIFNLHAYG